MSENAPVKKLNYSGIEAAIWENQRGESQRESFSVRLRKIYKKKDGTWEDPKSFEERDLPMLAKAVNDAHWWIQVKKDELSDSAAATTS